MGKTHWKKLNNPNFLGTYALNPGEDLVATINYANEEEFVGVDGKKDGGLVIHFVEKDIKPMIVNATNAKQISKLANSPYIEDWKGEKIQLYAAEVSAFGKTVDALRIRDFHPREEEYICKDCGCIIEDKGKYTARAIAQSSQSKFGKTLCMECAKKAKDEQEKTAKEGDILGDEDNED